MTGVLCTVCGSLVAKVFFFRTGYASNTLHTEAKSCDKRVQTNKGADLVVFLLYETGIRVDNI
jgi:hypothetical protein